MEFGIDFQLVAVDVCRYGFRLFGTVFDDRVVFGGGVIHTNMGMQAGDAEDIDFI